jgi:hypothetical protein
MLKQKKGINELVATSLENKTILCLGDLFKLVKQLMEYVEKYNVLSGDEKRDIIYDNISLMLYKTHTTIIAKNYVSIIFPFIEELILISKSKVMINLKRGCITKCI